MRGGRENLRSLTVQSTGRHEAGRVKSDPMSRILCIVPILPERLPCSRLIAELAADPRYPRVNPRPIRELLISQSRSVRC